ncbi:MAG TPA: outer membrane lipoprotein-sorting protein [Puia sp.]|nr:outer membrane lipoprotein-sorting protein [Puia sp.]
MRQLPGLLIIFLCLQLIAQPIIKPQEVLHQAEIKRIPWEKMSVIAMLIDSNYGDNNNTTYQIYFDGNKTLVEFLGPGPQKGNLVLMKGYEMWLYIRSAAKPVKITALQKLSASASFLDIARLNWSADYIVESLHEEKYAKANNGDYLLHLKSSSPENAYKKIDLWVDEKSKKALKADIYLSSEKLYKTILFTKYQMVTGREINMELELIDHFNKERRSVIKFSKPQQEKAIPENYFIADKLPEVSKMLNP